MGILELAIPAMISSLSGLITVLICIRLLGQADAHNYYLLAVFLPINYVMIAIYESMRSASLTLSSLDAYQGKLDKISLNIASLIIALAIIFIAFLFLLLILSQQVGHWVGVIAAEQQTFIMFSSIMLTSGIVTGMVYVFTSTFFAMKKPLVGMSVTLSSAFLTCLLTSYFVRFIAPTWLSYVLGSLIACIFCLLVSLILMQRQGVFLFFDGFARIGLVINNLTPIMKVGMPVLLSLLVIFSSLFIINSTLSYFNPSILTGYSIAYRVQNVVILPAITIGTAIAILSSKARAEGDRKEEHFIQSTGLAICFLFYILLSGLIYYFRDNVMALVTANVELIHAGSIYLKTVALTYVCMGPNLAYLTLLEQSGFGCKSFFINVPYFLFAVGIGCMAAIHYQHYEYLYITIAITNILFFVYILLLVGIKLQRANQLNLVRLRDV